MTNWASATVWWVQGSDAVVPDRFHFKSSSSEAYLRSVLKVNKGFQLVYPPEFSLSPIFCGGCQFPILSDKFQNWDSNIVRVMPWQVEVSGDRWLIVLFGVTQVFWQSVSYLPFGFTNILHATFCAVDEIHQIGAPAGCKAVLLVMWLLQCLSLVIRLHFLHTFLWQIFVLSVVLSCWRAGII